jgi:hypothetical protein
MRLDRGEEATEAVHMSIILIVESIELLYGSFSTIHGAPPNKYHRHYEVYICYFKSSI